MPPIYVSDLDGTMLRPDATLGEVSRTGLQRLLAAGIPVTVASARSALTMREVMAGVPFTLPVVTFNGICTVDLASGRRLKVRHLAAEVLASVMDSFSVGGLEPLVVSSDGAADHSSFRRIANEAMDWYIGSRRSWGDQRLRELPDLAPSLRETVFGINAIERSHVVHGVREHLERELGDRVGVNVFEDCYYPGWHWLMVSDGRANKGHAVAELLADHGYDPADLVAFGDNHNDLGMMRLAGRAVAVANAAEEVRAMAHDCIDSNATDSVVRYMLADAEEWLA